MPWSDFSNDVRQLQGMVSAAVRGGLNSFETVQYLGESARAAGLKFGFETYTSVSKLWAVENRIYRGAQELQAAWRDVERTGIDQGITGRMINPAPWSPSLTDWNLNQRVGAKMQYTVDTPEGPMTRWWTQNYRTDQLQTVGQLMEDAQLRIDTSGTESPPTEATLTGYAELIWR